jgi:hypothetical protein
MAPMLPYHKIMSGGLWSGKAVYNRNTIKGFKKGESVIKMNSFNSDYITLQNFYDTRFIDVEDETLTYLSDPSPGWANPTDCGDFPCTAPYNVLMSFDRTIWEGKKPALATADF